MLDMRRLVLTLAVLSFVTLVPPSAVAQSPITFTFTSTIDATPVGGLPDTPLVITYSFVPDLAPGSGPIGSSPTLASYGPIDIQLQIGEQQVAATGPGTGITVFNDAGTTIVEDSYDVRADFPSTSGGQLFGLNVDFFRFLLVDSDRTMFSSTALPLTTDFASQADIAYVDVALRDSSGFTILLFAAGQPFTLTTPAPRCASGLTTIAELRVAVASLTTSDATKATLLASLDGAESAAASGDAAGARLHLRNVINKLVTRSNLDTADPDSIPVAQANELLCGVANVLIGVR